ncbi:hypothetical protein [Rubrobacter indicoceani]|uniref:hypothetical protein n=1 Tax=Rubrobacter indicoceani TaxID=2051957 RepID=UPI000E5B3A6A|nr:hypothetical protein [Rubrobacter indicoceani]
MTKNSGNPNGPLLLMMGMVPLIVVLAVIAAVLLARSGFGLAVALGVPFGVSMVVTVVTGVWLARVAARRRDRR